VVWLGIVTVLINIVFPVFNVTQFSHRLALIPDELQGRVNSVFRLIAIGLSSIGAALSGVLIQWIGVTATVVVFGLWLVACGILTWANSDVRRAQAIADM
jgi:predicted MFS family arabinose efflux permease